MNKLMEHLFFTDSRGALVEGSAQRRAPDTHPFKREDLLDRDNSQVLEHLLWLVNGNRLNEPVGYVFGAGVTAENIATFIRFVEQNRETFRSEHSIDLSEITFEIGSVKLCDKPPIVCLVLWVKKVLETEPVR